MKGYGYVAARRFNDPQLYTPIAASAMRWDVAPSLVATVLSVEMLARGPLWRRPEALVARTLLWLGVTRRVEYLSLGIAQIQPRHLQKVAPLSDRVEALLSVERAIDECARLLRHFCDQAQLNRKRPDTWSLQAWSQLSAAYGGDSRYGSVLSTAHIRLRPRWSGLPSTNTCSAA